MFFDQLPDKGLICAHRGVRSLAPENTILALSMAKKCGAHCLETDVQLSKDGQLLIFHDDTLTRTTDIAVRAKSKNNSPLTVDKLQVSELRQLDAGSWFLQTDPFGTVATGEVPPGDHALITTQKIPLLREILNWSRTSAFPINLEIKSLQTQPGDVRIVDAVMDMLVATGTMDLVLLSSLRHEYLLRARALHPHIPLAVLAENEHPQNLQEYLTHFSAIAYHPEETMCSADLIAQLKQAGIRVNCWTVNDSSRAQQLFQAGAGVITDWPQHLTTLD